MQRRLGPPKRCGSLTSGSRSFNLVASDDWRASTRSARGREWRSATPRLGSPRVSSMSCVVLLTARLIQRHPAFGRFLVLWAPLGSGSGGATSRTRHSPAPRRGSRRRRAARRRRNPRCGPSSPWRGPRFAPSSSPSDAPPVAAWVGWCARIATAEARPDAPARRRDHGPERAPRSGVRDDTRPRAASAPDDANAETCAVDDDDRLTYCRACGGRGRIKCEACDGTGVENHWLYGPAENPGWGPRGEWRDPTKPPRRREVPPNGIDGDGTGSAS